MGTHSDGLLDELLFRIALTSDKGLDIQEVHQIFTSFHARFAENEVDDEDGDESDILFSLKPPVSKSKNDLLSSDPQQLEEVWKLLVDHPDVFVVQTDEQKSDEPQLSNPSSQPVDQPQFLSAFGPMFALHLTERLHTTESRIWFALTDHGVDYKRIPRMEFECLKAIAAAGPKGILQPEVMRATGQDKRSVPKRTEALEKRGLIIKELCVAQNIKTSLLRFKKLAEHTSDGPAVDSERRMIRYGEWWNLVISILKKHGNFMAFEDLRREMGIVGKQWESRALRRCMKRLARAGCVSHMRARVTPAEAEDDSEEDAEVAHDNAPVDSSFDLTYEPKEKKKRKKRLSQARWVRCVRLMHEPTEKDKHAFTSTTKLPKETSTEVQNDSDTDDNDDALAELDVDDPMIQSIVDPRNWNEEEVVERIPPQWQPQMHQTHFMFHYIDSCGSAGISTMDLIDRGLGHFWRRPLEELIGRLTDVWHTSQPSHLRHLSVVRDTATFSTISHYQFRTFENYKRLVAEGKLSWQAINVQPETLDAKPVDLDLWGFPQVRPSEIHGAEGTANLTHLKNTVSSGQLTRNPNNGRSKLPKTSKKRTTRVKKVRIVPDVPTTEQVSSDVPETPQHETYNADTLIDLIQDSPAKARSTRKPSTTKHSSKDGATPRRAVWQMPQKRANAEIEAYRLRARRVAEFRVKVELGHILNQPVETGSPPRKRRKTKEQITENTDAAVQDVGDLQPAIPPQATQDFEAVNDPCILPEDRLAAVEAEILTLSTPGVYVNPPGAAQLKMSKILPRGRPRSYLIAVMKSEKLRTLEWFTPDLICPDPMPRSQISANGQLIFKQPDPDDMIAYLQGTPSPSHAAITQLGPQSEQSTPAKRGRKRKAPDTLREQVTKKLATGSLQKGIANSAATYHHGSTSDVDVGSQRLVLAGLAGSQGSQSSPAAASPETNTNTESGTSQNETTVMEINPVLTLSAVATDAPLQKAQAPTPMDMDVDMDAEEHRAADLAKEGSNGQPTNEDAMEFQQEFANRPILSVTEVMADKAEPEVQFQGKKVGVPRSAGNVGYNRREMILKIVRKHGGIFGGERELYYPFVTIWEKAYKQRPDRHTLDRAITNLVNDGRLRKIAFTFEIFDGKIVTKHIVMEPDVDPESEAVKELQQRIIEYYPLTYLPDDADVAPDLKDQIYGHVVNIRRHKIQTSMQTHFPRDENAFVTRQYAASARPKPSEVTLGMTEAMLKRDVATRKRKREQEERRQERYMRAQQEEEIDEAQAALQTDFQLVSYQHEPKEAVVDRGPHGRGRLSKLQRWDAEEAAPRRKTLGLLAASKKDKTLPQPQLLQQPHVTRMPTLPSRFSTTQATLHRFPARTDGYEYGAGIVEFMSLTSPYQRFYPQSGTFSTDALVCLAPCKNVWSAGNANRTSVGDILPMSFADIFREATYTTVGSPSGFGMLLPDTHAAVQSGSPAIAPFSEAQKRAIPRATPIRPALWKAPSAKTPLSRPPTSKPNMPRAARNGIFVMSPAEERRLIIAVVVVRSLTGGLEQHANWHIIHQIFHYKFAPDYCRQRYGQLKGKLGATAEKLQAEFQQMYLEAYEQGEVPEVDFAELHLYDWLAVVEWAEARLDPSQMVAPTNELPDLPADRQHLDNKFDVKLPEDIYGVTREDFWAAHITQIRREELTMSWTYCKPLVTPKKVSTEPDHLLLAKSWVRANVLTPDKAFDDNLAHEKLLKLGDDTLPKALEELLGAKIIRMDNKGRSVPGRNYDVNDVLLRTFRRPWDVDQLRRAAAFKPILDAEFRTRGKIVLGQQTGDPEMMALTNLVANGRCKVIPLLPAVNNDFDAPWPRLSKWGFTEGNYKTVHMNKERLYFGLEIHATSSYINGLPLVLKDPPLTKKFRGEMGARLPLWTDIHGKLIEEMWGMMRMATLYLLVFRPGITAEVLTRSFDGKIWKWEIDMFLQWAEEVGVAERIEENAADGEVGWRAAEWWWLAFAE